MKLVISAVAVLGVLGALPFIAVERADSGAAFGSVQKSKEAHVRYRLSVSGREGSCTVTKKGDAESDRTGLELSPQCVELMPRLAEVRYWQEDGAGELRFVAADGRAVVEFFAADGVAYESLKPSSPLIALKVQ